MKIVHIVKDLQIKNQFSDLSRADNGKVRLSVHCHNMQRLMINIMLKFHLDIPKNKGITNQKPFFGSINVR